MKNTINVTDLTVAYDLKPVLFNVHLNLPMGQLIAVVGPNGAGKSTLLKTMLGLLTPVTGSVTFPWNQQQLKNKIGYVPQTESVDWDFPTTVFDVVLMGRYGHLGWLKHPRANDRRLAHEMIEKVGMGDFCNRQISQLSGGQQQRIFLARALVQEADIYFLDEPFKGVDAQTEKSIVGLLKELRNNGKTVIVVHHDLQTVSDYFDWVTLINTSIIANGPVNEVFHEDNLAKAYRHPQTILRGAVS